MNARRILSSVCGHFLDFFEEVEIFFVPSSNTEGGDILDYITWNDAIQIALLVFAIISCFYKKK